MVWYFKIGESGSLLPDIPKLISPADESTITTTTPTFTWASVASADYYGIFIYKGFYDFSDNALVVAEKVYGTSYTIPSGKLLSGNTYTWTVVGYNSYGYSNPSQIMVWYFKVGESGSLLPGTFNMISPADESTITTTTPTFTWTSADRTEYYAIFICKGRDDLSDSTVVIKTKVYGTSYTVPAGKLSSGNTYTWWVTAYNSYGFTPASNNSVWHFKIGLTASKLPAPNLLSPADKESLFDNELAFSWTFVSEASYYVFWVGKGLYSSPGISDTVYSTKVYGTSIKLSAEILPHGEIYTWAVWAVDSNSNQGYYSEKRHFSVIQLGIPVLIYPHNGATTYAPLMLEWKSIYGADGYVVIIKDSEGNVVYNKYVYFSSVSLYLPGGKNYSWCVVAFKSDYIIGLSDYWAFYHRGGS